MRRLVHPIGAAPIDGEEFIIGRRKNLTGAELKANLVCLSRVMPAGHLVQDFAGNTRKAGLKRSIIHWNAMVVRKVEAERAPALRLQLCESEGAGHCKQNVRGVGGVLRNCRRHFHGSYEGPVEDPRRRVKQATQAVVLDGAARFIGVCIPDKESALLVDPGGNTAKPQLVGEFKDLGSISAEVR